VSRVVDCIEFAFSLALAGAAWLIARVEQRYAAL